MGSAASDFLWRLRRREVRQRCSAPERATEGQRRCCLATPRFPVDGCLPHRWPRRPVRVLAGPPDRCHDQRRPTTRFPRDGDRRCRLPERRVNTFGSAGGDLGGQVLRRLLALLSALALLGSLLLLTVTDTTGARCSTLGRSTGTAVSSVCWPAHIDPSGVREGSTRGPTRRKAILVKVHERWDSHDGPAAVT